MNIEFKNAILDNVGFIVKLAFQEMKSHLEFAYDGSFDWSTWEFEIRNIISNDVIGELYGENKIELILVNGDIVGIIWTSKQTDESLWIDTIIISPYYQGKGIGTKVIDLLPIRFVNITKIELGIQKTNDRAMKFYKKLGFIQEADSGMEYYKTYKMVKYISK